MNRTTRQRLSSLIGVWGALVALALVWTPSVAQAHDDAGDLGLSAGYRHTCALDAEGSISWWGEDFAR